MTTEAVPPLGQILSTFGGPVAVRIEVDTGTEGVTFGLWDEGEWDEALWGSENPSWFDITAYALEVNLAGGAERWGERFQAAAATIRLDNTSGIFTPESGVPNPFVLPFRPGRKIRVVAVPDPDDPDTVAPLFTGQIDSANDEFGDAGFSIVSVLQCSDFMATWSQHNPPALETPTGVQTTDERVEATLDRLSWPGGERDVQTGEHSMTSSWLAQSTLEECQRAAEAEGGAFFASPDGKATFRARDWLITDTRSTEIQGYIGYEEVPEGAQSAHLLDVRTSWERALIYNQILFARTGSTVQLAEDEDSKDLYGIRSYQRLDYQNNSDAQVLALAERQLAISKDLRLRVEEATITPNADPDNEDLNRLIWDTRYGDLLSIRIKPPWGWELEKLVQVMGIAHRITADDWTVTLKLDDAMINFLEEPE